MYDSKIWGPVFWSFLDIVAFHYPKYPNDVIKKKYYHFIQNIPLFIPDYSMAGDFEKLLNQYPIKPYLDNKKSLIKWVNFIHNKINEKLNKPLMPLELYYKKYQERYQKKPPKKNYSYFIILLLIGVIAYYYKK
jgi:hypothetical protein